MLRTGTGRSRVLCDERLLSYEAHHLLPPGPARGGVRKVLHSGADCPQHNSPADESGDEPFLLPSHLYYLSPSPILASGRCQDRPPWKTNGSEPECLFAEEAQELLTAGAALFDVPQILAGGADRPDKGKLEDHPFCFAHDSHG